MTLEFTNTFDQFFRENFDLSEEIIEAAFIKPDKTQSTSFGLNLYLKRYNSSIKTKTFLLLGTDNRSINEKFSFSYWLPEETVNNYSELISMLELFIHRFGIELEYNNSKAYIIKKRRRLIHGKLEKPEDQLFDYEYKNRIAANYCWFLESELVGTFNHIDINFLFAINTYKYQFWLNEIKYIELEVRKGWYEWVKNITTIIKPNGQSKLIVQRPQEIKRNKKIEGEIDLVPIEVPENYKWQFSHIIEVVNNLGEGEKIGIRLSSFPKKCLFCGSKELSKEHIIPDWFKTYFDSKFITIGYFNPVQEESFVKVVARRITDNHQYNLLGFTDKAVCKQCNTGWMSQLEENAIKTLVRGKNLKKIEELELIKSTAFSLSCWLLKIALLTSNKLFGNRFSVLNDLCSELKKGKLSKGILIEVARTPFYDLIFFTHTGSKNITTSLLKLKNIKRENAEKLTENYFQFNIQIGYLMFRISYLNPENQFYRESGAIKTLVIHPFKKPIPHMDVTDKKLLSLLDLEAHRFDLFTIGLSLVEKQAAPNKA